MKVFNLIRPLKIDGKERTISDERRLEIILYKEDKK